MAITNHKNRTSIQLSKETKQKLEELKVIPSQTYDDVIEFLIKKKMEALIEARKKLDGGNGILAYNQGVIAPGVVLMES